MSRFTRALGNTMSRVLFTDAVVGEIVDHGPHFRSIELTGDDLRGATWNVGDKIQVRTQADGLGMRTYTPIRWDAERGTASLLAYVHGTGPGSAWVEALTPGVACAFFGPRSSLQLDESTTPLIFVGDETSFALAAAWRNRYPDAPPIAEIFEVTDAGQSATALDAVGVRSDQLFTRSADGAHLQQLISTLLDVLGAQPGTTLCLTGKAQSIAVIRRELKAAGAANPTRVKAYWDENRAGLD